MENTPHGIRRTLSKVRKMKELRGEFSWNCGFQHNKDKAAARMCPPVVVILCMHSVLIGGEVQKLLLETAYDMEMIDGSLVFVPYDTLLYSLPYRNVTYPALRSNGKLLRAYDAVLTVTIDSPQTSFYESYREAMEKREVAGTLKPQEVMHGMFVVSWDNLGWGNSNAGSPCRCLLSLEPFTTPFSLWLTRCIIFGNLGNGCLEGIWRDKLKTWLSRYYRILNKPQIL